jgi:hypothetical protein
MDIGFVLPPAGIHGLPRIAPVGCRQPAQQCV